MQATITETFRAIYVRFPGLTGHAVKEALLAWASRRGPFISIPDFKEALGITRRYAMPLLEYLDDLKWTRREGDGRRILLKPGD